MPIMGIETMWPWDSAGRKKHSGTAVRTVETETQPDDGSGRDNALCILFSRHLKTGLDPSGILSTTPCVGFRQVTLFRTGGKPYYVNRV